MILICIYLCLTMVDYVAGTRSFEQNVAPSISFIKDYSLIYVDCSNSVRYRRYCWGERNRLATVGVVEQHVTCISVVPHHSLEM